MASRDFNYDKWLPCNLNLACYVKECPNPVMLWACLAAPSAKQCSSPIPEGQRMALGVWAGEQTPGPSGTVVRRWYPQSFSGPRPPMSRLSAKSHTWATAHPPACRDVGVRGPIPARMKPVKPSLCVFSSPSQHLSSPDQRRKGFLRPSFTRRANLGYCAATGLALGKARAPVITSNHLSPLCPPGRGPICVVGLLPHFWSGSHFPGGCSLTPSWAGTLGFALSIYPSARLCPLADHVSQCHTYCHHTI